MHEKIVDSSDTKSLERLLMDGIDPEVGGKEVVGGHVTVV
jgi:hypothetical protein